MGQRRRAVVIAVSAAVVLGGAVLLWPGSDAPNVPTARPSVKATPSEGAEVPQEISDEEAIARLEAQPDDHDSLQDPLRNDEHPSGDAVTTASTTVTPAPPLTNQATALPQSPAPLYADDDDSDEAAIWRLKQQHQQQLEDEYTEVPDSAISSSTTIDMAMPTSGSTTLYLEQNDTPDQSSR